MFHPLAKGDRSSLRSGEFSIACSDQRLPAYHGTKPRCTGCPALAAPADMHPSTPLACCAGAAVQPMDLEAAIAAQTKDTPPDQVTELVLDTCKATKVSGLEKFSNLKSLTLNGCGLTTLDGFPTLPELRRLELSDNNISDGLEALQDAALFQLKSLSLAGNKFATLEDLDPLVRPSLCACTALVPFISRLRCTTKAYQCAGASGPYCAGDTLAMTLAELAAESARSRPLQLPGH